MKKYELTDETIVVDGHTLHRIRYSNGVLGGFIESEANLSQEGGCMVLDEAMVYGDARVFADALVSGNAQVYGFCMICALRTGADILLEFSRSPKIYGRARIAGNAKVARVVSVFDDACISGNARVYSSMDGVAMASPSEPIHVYGSAKIFGKAGVRGRAQVFGHAQVYGKAKVLGRAEVFDYAEVCGTAEVKGSEEVFGDSLVQGDFKSTGRETEQPRPNTSYERDYSPPERYSPPRYGREYRNHDFDRFQRDMHDLDLARAINRPGTDGLPQ